MGVSNTLLACINCLTLCISLPFIIVGFIIKKTASSPCDPIMYKPLLAVGFTLLVISLLGLLGGCCRIQIFLWLYAIALFILIVGLLASVIIGGVILKGNVKGEDVFGGLKEYHLEGFSAWLRKIIVGPKNWKEIKDCMIKNEVCSRMHSFRTMFDFMAVKSSNLSSIETGCCKPPAQCGFEFNSDTEWNVPDEGLASEDPDCKTWDNDKEKLCYSCESCKAGYLAIFVKGWKKITILNAIITVVVFIVFIIAVYGLIKAKLESRFVISIAPPKKPHQLKWFLKETRRKRRMQCVLLP
ncbi:hypothetical protein Cgig2_006930 [Carnegiea gigantea]|uniref:Tetraspanin n=1 Tax=Carnegiea gigantea TaxID=171969 RepID=A0A9Q1KBM6_9CARY|nr:hypothetical protein Cgig2_006930 [Carnegiea gigantea]